MNKLIIFGVSLLSIFAASCSNDNDAEKPVTGGKQISVTAHIQDNADLRIIYNDNVAEENISAEWSENESFTIYNGTSNDGRVFTKDAEGNTFRGLLPEGSDKYYSVYGNDVTFNEGVLSFNISSQNATLDNGLKEFLVAENQDLTTPIQFKHKMAVLKLQLTLPEDENGSLNQLNLLGLHTKANYNLASGEFSYSKTDRGNIELKGASVENHKIVAYAAVFPEDYVSRSISINVSIGENNYVYFVLAAGQLAAGKVTPVNATMVKPEYVDLDLPSGTLWATMDVGANSPAEPGSYYAWGEICPKSSYSWDTYMCSEGECSTAADPLNDKTNIAGSDFDVAHVTWGGLWEMPTRAMFDELANSEYVTKTDDGTSVTYTSKSNGKSITILNSSRCWTAEKSSNTGSAQLSEDNMVRMAGYPVRPIIRRLASGSTIDNIGLDNSELK